MPAKILKTRVNKLSETDAAYLAGLIDGEGTIGTYKTGKGFSYRIIQVVSTNKEVVEWVRDTIGCGAIRLDDRSIANPKHSCKYVYSISAQVDVESIIEQIGKYLIIKKKHYSALV